MSGGIQIVRLETRDTVDRNLVRHILGEVRPDTAVEAVGRRENTILVSDVEGATEYARSFARTGKKGGRPPKHAVDCIFGGTPPIGSPDEWPREKEDEYYLACLAWLSTYAGPHSRIAAAAIHRDETSAHLHVLFVPVSEGKDGRLKLGFTALLPRFSPGAGRARDRMSRLQDFFHAEVASKHGLERGVKGSQAKHEKVDRAKAAEFRAQTAKEKEKRAEARAKEEERRADEVHEKAGRIVRTVEAQKKRVLDEAREEAERLVREGREEGKAAAKRIKEEAKEAGRQGLFGRPARRGRAYIEAAELAEAERDAAKAEAVAAEAERERVAATVRAAYEEVDAWRMACHAPGRHAKPELKPGEAAERIKARQEGAARKGRLEGRKAGAKSFADRLLALLKPVMPEEMYEGMSEFVEQALGNKPGAAAGVER